MSEFGTEILIFAGTTEGRELAEHLADAGVRCTVSVATEYGAQILGPGKGRSVLQGRLTEEQMEFLIREEGYTCVVDATHPFATEVSAQIRKACEETKVPYLRLARDTEGELPDGGFGIYEAASMQEAAKILRSIPGNLFLTTGSKDLPLLAEEIGEPERLYVRVLPSVESLRICMECGIPAGHLIAMQGPFTQELNVDILLQTGARAVLTKESGKVGGFDEKVAAAKEVGIPVVVVRNPEKGSKDSDLLSFEEVLERLAKITGVRALAQPEREYIMVAAGPGDARHLTEEAREAVEGADVVFGAPSVIARAKETGLLRAGKLRPLQWGGAASRCTRRRGGACTLPLSARYLIGGSACGSLTGDLGGRGHPEHPRKRAGRNRAPAQRAQSLSARVRSERCSQHCGVAEGGSCRQCFAAGDPDRLRIQPVPGFRGERLCYFRAVGALG